MDSEVVIRAETLGKKYVIGHQSERERYIALRDVLGRAARNIVRTTADALRGRLMVPGDSTEEFWALNDVNFEVKRGEVLGIIGRNGAGKSTLLKILSRITEPSEGRVQIRGRVASLLEVGTGFHPELSGRENIYLNGAILGMTRAEIRRKFDEIVAFAEVEKFLDTPVKRYSSGMYVRLAFAVAAHLEPEILLIDEVLAVGDAEFQKKCLGKMNELSRKQIRTVLFVSHNLSAISALCTRAILIAEGRILFAGSVASVIERYSKISLATHSISFVLDPKQPSIAKIEVDSKALVDRNLLIDIMFVSPWPITPMGGLVLRTATGHAIWGSNALFHPSPEPRKSLLHGFIRCEAYNLPLIGGEYLLSVWLGDRHKDFDCKLDILRIHLGNDSIDPRRPPASSNGSVDWPAVWRSTADEPN